MTDLFPTNEEFERFAYPWKFDNEFGILEIDADEIQVEKWIGNGRKASTRKAVWKGREIALKQVDTFDGPYSYWEIARYHDLRSVQGVLIPKLYFLSRDKVTGKRLLGLELGIPLDAPTLPTQAAELHSKLVPLGWCQRDCSWRSDNVFWMKNKKPKRKDKKAHTKNYRINQKKKKMTKVPNKRLVAIDLESWIPTYHPNAPIPEQQKSIFGLPILHPTELTIHHRQEDYAWDDEDFWDESLFYGGRMTKGGDVTVYAFKTPSLFRSSMERLLTWPNELESLVANPLFVLIGRSGRAVVGFDKIDGQTIERNDSQDLEKALKQNGWKVSFYHLYLYGKKTKDGNVVLFDLSFLKPINTDESPSALREKVIPVTKSGGTTRESSKSDKDRQDLETQPDVESIDVQPSPTETEVESEAPKQNPDQTNPIDWSDASDHERSKTTSEKAADTKMEQADVDENQPPVQMRKSKASMNLVEMDFPKISGIASEARPSGTKFCSSNNALTEKDTNAGKQADETLEPGKVKSDKMSASFHEKNHFK